MLWATGYRPDYSWIQLPVFDGRTTAPPARYHRRPGLYFLGLTWQHTRGSALIGWVKDDADSSPTRSPPSHGASMAAAAQEERV